MINNSFKKMELSNWGEIQSFPCNGDYDKFCESINIWISKPHCLTKKIGGTDCFELGGFSGEGVQKCIKYFSFSLHSLDSSTDLKGSVKVLIDEFYRVCQKSNKSLTAICEVVLRILYPKSGQYFPGNVELLIKDHIKQSVIFTKPVTCEGNNLVSKFPYTIIFENNNLVLCTMANEAVDDGISWLRNTLLPKLVSKMENGCDSTSIDSHRLISTNKYLLTYSRLKDTYLKSILEFWNESTNPEKFINEDIAIASYLISLWGDKAQNFVDLGCGNGLLVYILTCEGHKGHGIDVRARKIWKAYPIAVNLEEATISPSLECTYPEADWIIGNHSDELSPWIPIIAARSSYTTNFFLLPCCPFELNGCKYIRNNTSKSSYLDYMDYLVNISSICGFDIDKDRLKIPSTRRLCIVSKKRLYSRDEEPSQKKHIQNLVNIKINNSYDSKIKLRSSEEKVRNCTQLNKGYTEKIVHDIANYFINSSPEGSWREGEFIPISQLIPLLTSEGRTFLKAQCGGLQTLLRNHKNIFILYDGMVKLRKPTVRPTPPSVVKQKKCWFFFFHPDSCPLSDEHCTYKHTD